MTVWIFTFGVVVRIVEIVHISSSIYGGVSSIVYTLPAINIIMLIVYLILHCTLRLLQTFRTKQRQKGKTHANGAAAAAAATADYCRFDASTLDDFAELRATARDDEVRANMP